MEKEPSVGSIQLPVLDRLMEEFKKVQARLQEIEAKIDPKQEYFDLKEACAVKGVNYASLQNARYTRYQPNCGEPDKCIMGRKRWSRETVHRWIHQSDEDLDREYRERKEKAG